MYWLQCIGCSVLVAVYWLQCTGCSVLVALYWLQCTGCMSYNSVLLTIPRDFQRINDLRRKITSNMVQAWLYIGRVVCILYNPRKPFLPTITGNIFLWAFPLITSLFSESVLPFSPLFPGFQFCLL